MEKVISSENTQIGKRIKIARNLANVSRKDFEKLGISMHTLQSWELGRNPLNKKTASKLIEILHSAGVNCSASWLLRGEGKSPTLFGTDFIPYPTLDKDLAPLVSQENVIQKEIEFFKSNNPNAIVIMVSDDAMAPSYRVGDFVGGIQYLQKNNLKNCLGHDCVIESEEGTFFRRLIERNNGYALTSLNPETELVEPVIFTQRIISATPIIWHRWKFKNQN